MIKKIKKWFNRSQKATIGGYVIAMYNAILMLDIDNLNFTLPSTYLKLFGAIGLPILMGHQTEVKETPAPPDVNEGTV